MNKHEYMSVAIDKTIGFLREQGVKYRRSDFEGSNSYQNRAFSAGGGITVLLSFEYGDRGKKLKGIKDKFLNYLNARVMDGKIQFSYTLKELELETVKTITPEEGVNIEKVMAKITKLLALSESPVESEAIAASMKAQELLAKYNLEIETITGAPKREEIDQCIADVGTGNKWKYSLAEVLARSYCCKVYYHGSENVVFYGYKSDIVIARRVFCYLYDVGNKLARTYTKVQRETWGEARGVYNSFCNGFVHGVDEQLSKHCKALMLITPQEVQESFNTFSEAFKKMNHSIDTTDADAYHEGKTEGKRALNAQYIEG